MFRMGSGCGSVGRAVTFDIRTFAYYQLYWKDEINKKRPEMAHFFLMFKITDVVQLVSSSTGTSI